MPVHKRGKSLSRIKDQRVPKNENMNEQKDKSLCAKEPQSNLIMAFVTPLKQREPHRKDINAKRKKLKYEGLIKIF